MLLGRTANGLFWMARQMERAEATARLLDAGQHIALTRGARPADWRAVLVSAGVLPAFEARHGMEPTAETAIDFLLRDRANASSVLASFDAARSNARMVRTALTREAWEATNDCWRQLGETLAGPVSPGGLVPVLSQIKRSTALIRGTFQTTMLRNDIHDFAQLGTAIERADMTARIVDVKYHVLLPSAAWVGSALDMAQWDTVLRSVAAHKSYSWVYGPEIRSEDVIDFLLLNPRMPRSLAWCYDSIVQALGHLARDYGSRPPSHDTAAATLAQLRRSDVGQIFDDGLHETLQVFLRDNARLSAEIARDYRFTESAACV